MDVTDARGAAEPNEPTVVSTVKEVRARLSAVRAADRRIGFVPTMGALHAGHVSLIEAARRDDLHVVVSIFVNPTQFGTNEDFDAYPRVLRSDVEMCRRSGVNTVFAPTAVEIYPPDDQTRVHPGVLAEPLCGAFRPGHFDGVCTVVAKLFNIVQPDVAYFGQKDAQQAIVIRRMATDLMFPVRIEVLPTVREMDGLAMSSRNVRMSASERLRALVLYQALCAGRDALATGEASIGRVLSKMRALIDESHDLRVDYLSIVDAESLAPATAAQGRLLLAGAIRIGGTRLIDNILVELP